RGPRHHRARLDPRPHAPRGQRGPEGRGRAGQRAARAGQGARQRRLPHAIVRAVRELSRGPGGSVMTTLLYFVVMTLVMLGLARFLPGFRVEGWVPALIGSVVLALINAIVKPILFVLTLPFTILTLGLFLFVLNMICLWLAQALVPG